MVFKYIKYSLTISKKILYFHFSFFLISLYLTVYLQINFSENLGIRIYIITFFMKERKKIEICNKPNTLTHIFIYLVFRNNGIIGNNMLPLTWKTRSNINPGTLMRNNKPLSFPLFWKKISGKTQKLYWILQFSILSVSCIVNISTSDLLNRNSCYFLQSLLIFQWKISELYSIFSIICKELICVFFSWI